MVGRLVVWCNDTDDEVAASCCRENRLDAIDIVLVEILAVE